MDLSQPEGPDAADERKRKVREDERGVLHRSEGTEEQEKDERDARRHDLNFLRCTFCSGSNLSTNGSDA